MISIPDIHIYTCENILSRQTHRDVEDLDKDAPCVSVCARTEHFSELWELLWPEHNGNNTADNQLCERDGNDREIKRTHTRARAREKRKRVSSARTHSYARERCGGTVPHEGSLYVSHTCVMWILYMRRTSSGTPSPKSPFAITRSPRRATIPPFLCLRTPPSPPTPNTPARRCTFSTAFLSTVFSSFTGVNART